VRYLDATKVDAIAAWQRKQYFTLELQKAKTIQKLMAQNPPMLHIIAETRTPKGIRPRLRRVLTVLCQTHGVSSSVCVILCTDKRIRALKLEFWGEDATTDVLTFPQWEPGDPFVPPVLGDIYISLPTAQQQAATHKHSLETEVVVLAAHGLTHLLGYDHQTKKGWKPFLEMQAQALAIA
jgi:probable rRNA maturation factor